MTVEDDARAPDGTGAPPTEGAAQQRLILLGGGIGAALFVLSLLVSFSWYTEPERQQLPQLPRFTTPTLPALPSELPSSFPTGLLTDFPTDLPTDFPTDLPTDFPTELPTDFPDLPSLPDLPDVPGGN